MAIKPYNHKIESKIASTLTTGLLGLVLLCLLLLGYLMYFFLFEYVPPPIEDKPTQRRIVAPVAMDDNTIENGVHVSTGLVAAQGYKLVKQQCLGCHSAKLITQNRMSRATWKETIVWMQETQGLWDLGQNETPILDYLAANYAPQKVGRRQNLEVEEWYLLN